MQIPSFEFQSTLPARGATEWLDVGFNVSRPFQSTLPARGATATGTVYQPGYFLISIHAPRTGSDASTQERFASRAVISIHAPRTGSDPQRNPVPICTRYFNPRSPHGERHQFLPVLAQRGHFNPRSPHGERLRQLLDFRDVVLIISIHAPRTGSDVPSCFALIKLVEFQSTLPARGATRCPNIYLVRVDISIHAPRTGSDWRRRQLQDLRW